MASLLETLAAPSKRPIVIGDCVNLVDQEVAAKGGISGFAIKAAYKVVKGIKPGFIPEVVDALLDDFCRRLQPLVDEAGSKSAKVSSFFPSNGGRVADALLGITDERARQAKNALVKGTYERLRPTAKKHVEEAVPRVGALIEKHAS